MRHLLGGLSQTTHPYQGHKSYGPTKLRVTQELQAGDIDRGTSCHQTKKCDTILSLKQPIRTKAALRVAPLQLHSHMVRVRASGRCCWNQGHKFWPNIKCDTLSNTHICAVLFCFIFKKTIVKGFVDKPNVDQVKVCPYFRTRSV